MICIFAMVVGGGFHKTKKQKQAFYGVYFHFLRYLYGIFLYFIGFGKKAHQLV